jgi:hypothetical protein
VIVGKDEVIELLLVALFCDGHLLLEDVPGMGKTTLAKALARTLGCSFSRIQFTPDLLPSDITGVNVFNQKSGDFEYRGGPIHAEILLADEINRAGPRTRQPCSKRWKSVRSPSTASPVRWPILFGAGHPEPGRAGGDLSAAGGAAGPFFAADGDRLPGARGGAHPPAPLSGPQPAGRGAAAARCG